VKKILIANRGEIAVRIASACREMELASVAVYSECDRTALHVRAADEAYAIGGSSPRDSYLRIDRVLDAAKKSGADGVHPGYGFLAENEAFAAAVRDAGLIFIGPTPEAIASMGSKTAARLAAARAGVPVVPGTDGALAADASEPEMAREAAAIGYPLLVKAVAGGGGKGMRTVTDPGDLADAVRAARSEAGTAFGDAAVYFERRLIRPRHIEVQLLGDHHGTVVPFLERECSIQRRHQKVVEETPSRAVSPALRAQIASAIDIVIQVERQEDGRRRVVSLQETNGMEGDIITTSELFKFERRGLDPQGNVLGELVATGIVPGFQKRLRERGVELPVELFRGNRDLLTTRR